MVLTFSDFVTEKFAIKQVEDFLSGSVSQSYLDYVSDDIFDPNPNISDYENKGAFLVGAKFLEFVSKSGDNNGNIVLQCGS
jgi:hypothetical protein